MNENPRHICKYSKNVKKNSTLTRPRQTILSPVDRPSSRLTHVVHNPEQRDSWRQHTKITRDTFKQSEGHDII
ncbi:hypothetical protein SK128_012937 [Halocaridina rubra]|uniref:Uncharacterized protein n=1 Tax=Halocaridina rubra TaxID=373956 RepID=A0AAN8ZYN4_HALRR